MKNLVQYSLVARQLTFGLFVLIFQDVVIAAFALASVGVGLLGESVILGLTVFYGSYAIAKTVGTIANAIGNGLYQHGQSVEQAARYRGANTN